MSETPDDRALDLLAAAAHAAAPPAPRGLDEMVVHAALVARNRARHRTAAVQALAAAAVVLLAVGAPLAWVASDGREPGAARALRFELPAGDAIATTADADFSIDAAEPARRALSVRAGAMLFDVVPLAARETFEVSTPHLHAEVRGTVFEVRASGSSSTVHVYEGHVAVRIAGRAHALAAGETFDSARGRIAEWSSPLASIGRAAASRRRPTRPSARAEAPSATDAAPSAATSPPTVARVEATTTRPTTVADDHGATDARARHAPAEDEATRGEAWMRLGDRLRLAQDIDGAVDAYERAADLLGPSRRTHAGYAAASLLVERLDAHERAFALLDRTLADRPGSPVEEHALELRTRALLARGRGDEARATARRYALRFPAGSAIEWMEELSGGR